MYTAWHCPLGTDAMKEQLAKLKHYMSPYYQEKADESILEWFITEYEFADAAASELWLQVPFEYDVKSFRTGAEETVYQSLSDLKALCEERSAHFAELARARGREGSLFAKAGRTPFAGGIVR